MVTNSVSKLVDGNYMHTLYKSMYVIHTCSVLVENVSKFCKDKPKNTVAACINL